jgi:lysophospholipase L1-like esterase
MKKHYLIWLVSIAILGCTSEAKSAEKAIKANDTAVRYTGRTQIQPDGSVTFDWVGTYLETRFTGGVLSLKITEIGTSYYNVFVDGTLHQVVKVCGTDTLINFVSNVNRKMHSLRIQKRTEGEFGKTTIHQFLLASSGYLQEEPKVRTRHIEFIGNSLTCGYGAEGKNRDEPFKLETENCNLSFSTITARYFDADYSLLAHSGKGAVRNYGDSVRVSAVTMKNKMLQTFDEGSTQQWNFTDYRPDLVVINLGTNDFSIEPQPYKSEFIESYTQMLKQLRQHYGNIPILCIYCCTVPAPVYSFYEASVDAMNDPNIFLLKMKNDLLNDTTDLGAVWHPNYNGHRKMAMNIIPYISTIMGWELSRKTIE